MLIANYWLVDVSEETRAAVQAAAEYKTVILYNDPKVTINEPLVLTRKIGWRCYDINASGYMHWAYAWKTDPWDNPGDDIWGVGRITSFTLIKKTRAL